MTDEEHYVLQNEMLRISVCPHEGGRVDSLFSKDRRLEFLLQSTGPRKAIVPGFEAQFKDGACAGIEECLPSVGVCSPRTRGGFVPDHGDYWQLPWEIEGEATKAALSIHATGFSRPLHFRKRLSLRNSSLHIAYTIENFSVEPTSLLYACHPLFAIEEGDRIVLPGAVDSVRLDYSRNHRLGASDTKIAWPLAGLVPPVDLSRTLSASSGTAEMFYTERLHQGWCGLYRTSALCGIVLRFDPALLPYLGLWFCYGGWPDEGPEPRQYAIAFEPTLAPYRSLEQAEEKNAAFILQPHASFQWNLEFQIAEHCASIREFSDFCMSANSTQL